MIDILQIFPLFMILSSALFLIYLVINHRVTLTSIIIFFISLLFLVILVLPVLNEVVSSNNISSNISFEKQLEPVIKPFVDNDFFVIRLIIFVICFIVGLIIFYKIIIFMSTSDKHLKKQKKKEIEKLKKKGFISKDKVTIKLDDVDENIKDSKQPIVSGWKSKNKEQGK